jgi:iron complex outermembrane receptor protein
MNKQRYMHLLMGAALTVLVGTVSQSVLAAAPAAAAATEELEEIVITGTSIRGIAPIGSTPVQYNRADIEADAPATISDALANVPQITSFGTEQQLSTTNRFRTSGFIPTIHNLDIGSTLTLFNGHRMAPSGTEATFADPSIIPTIALERVEVVSDGNSAVYGSDAVAGVVNFLYRRDLNGFEANLSTTQDPSTSYENRNLGLLWGKTFSRGSVMVAYEGYKHTAALLGEFPFIADADRRPLGGTERRATICAEPRIAIGATTYSGPTLAAGTAARCNADNALPLGFSGRRDSVLATARFSPADGVELWSELNYGKYTEPRLQHWTNISVTVPRTSPFFWVPTGGTTATSQTVNVLADNIFGLRTQSATSKIAALTLGATASITPTWTGDVRVHYSKTNDFWDALALDDANLRSLVASGQFNPYANAPVSGAGLNTTANSAAVLGQILNSAGTSNSGQQSLTELEAKVDGPLFAIGGGDVKAAIGFNHRTEALRQIQDAGCRNAGCSFFLRQRDDDFARGVNAAFVEVAAPLVSDANGKPGIRELTLSLAGRYDKYDKLKGEFTPKIAFNYKPTESLSFHGSWGKSYAAPNIGLTTSTFSIVQLGMNINGATFDTYNLGGGNSNLTSENAKTYSFGLDWKAAGALSGLSAGASYYNVVYNNIIYKPGFGDIISNPAFVGQRIVGNEATPTVPVVISASVMAAVMAQYPPDRIVAAGQTFHLVARTYAINMNEKKFSGLDLNVRYDWDSRLGKWGVGINANDQITRTAQPVIGGLISNDIGTLNAPKWQASLRAQWAAANIPLRLSWASNYRSAYKDTQLNANGTTTLRFTDWLYGGGSLVLHNLTVAYDLKNVFKGVSLQAHVQNLADAKPPFNDTTTGYDNQNYSPYGRQITLSLRAAF